MTGGAGLLLAVVVLRWTAPGWEPDTLRGCAAQSRFALPERLAEARLYGWPLEAKDDRVLLQSHRARAGAPDSFVVEHDGRPWTYCVTVTDISGNESPRCPGSCVGVGPWPVSAPAPIGPQGPLRAAWYDLAGRLVARPRPGGVYWALGRDSAGAVVWRSRGIVVVR